MKNDQTTQENGNHFHFCSLFEGSLAYAKNPWLRRLIPLLHLTPSPVGVHLGSSYPQLHRILSSLRLHPGQSSRTCALRTCDPSAALCLSTPYGFSGLLLPPGSTSVPGQIGSASVLWFHLGSSSPRLRLGLQCLRCRSVPSALHLWPQIP